MIPDLVKFECCRLLALSGLSKGPYSRESREQTIELGSSPMHDKAQLQVVAI